MALRDYDDCLTEGIEKIPTSRDSGNGPETSWWLVLVIGATGAMGVKGARSRSEKPQSRQTIALSPDSIQ